MRENRIVVAGAGLAGTVLAVYLARRGYQVDIFERHEDLRGRQDAVGRSINLTLSLRGFAGLAGIGIAEQIEAMTVPLYGRVMHDSQGERSYQAYGRHGEAIYSINRNALNRALLDVAEAQPGVGLHFGWICQGVDTQARTVEMEHSESGEQRHQEAFHIFAADGAFSRIRSQLLRRRGVDFSQEFIDQGYVELGMPATPSGDWPMAQPNATHIWPRGRFMLIGFPNRGGDFTCALHMPFEGEVSFASIKTGEDLKHLFKERFPDVLPLLPDLREDFFRTEPNRMVTIRCSPWTFDESVTIFGDAAHSIYPSYGQGANCSFEDCAVLDSCLDRSDGDLKTALVEFERIRKPSADAIADLATAHFNELQYEVAEEKFFLRKELEQGLMELLPGRYMPLYSMVSFTCLPYEEAQQRDRVQSKLMDRVISYVMKTKESDDLILGESTQQSIASRLEVISEKRKGVPYALSE